MTARTKSETNPLDCYFELQSLLCAAYEGSDYRFGVLHFAEPMEDGEYPEHLVDPPDFLRSGWTWFHEIPMVLHPARGALLLRRAEPMEDEPAKALTARIENCHSELTNLEWKIRHRLEKLGYWKNRSIVLGVAVVTSERCPRRLRPVSVDETVLIDRDDLPKFAARIDEVFDYYTTDEARPVDEWGPRLVEDLTGSEDYLGGFYDEQSCLKMYDDFDRPLDGAVEPAVWS